MSDHPTPLRRKLLFLTSLYPSSLGSGSQMRGAAILRMLAGKYEVHLLVLNLYERIAGPEDPAVRELCREVHALKIVSAPQAGTGARPSERSQFEIGNIAEVDRREADRVVLRYFQENHFDVLFIFRLQSLFAITGTLALFPRREFDLDEVVSSSFERMERLALAPGEALPAASVARLKGFNFLEKLYVPKFHRVFVSSEVEIGRVQQSTGFANAELLPNIYPPRPFLPYQPQAQPQEILFVGLLDFAPNTDAVIHFCREVFPLIRQAKGEGVSFRIVGFNCPESIRAFHGQDGIEVSGYVRDLDEVYTRASLVVVPLRAGGGTKLKILEAFSYGRPVVTTSIGAEGIAVTPGKELLIADTPETFAKTCLEVLDQPDLAQTLIREGRKLVQSRYTAEDLSQAYGESFA